jgi:hypothetical protein
LAFFSKHRAVEGRDQRRALPASGHVATAKVGHDVDPGQFRQQCRRIQLKRIAGAVELLRAVPNGLAVGADGDHMARIGPAFIDKRRHDVGVCPGQPIARQGGPMQFVIAAVVESQQLERQRRCERPMRMRQHPKRDTGVDIEFDQHTVDAVEGGAGHQADEKRSH